MNVNSVMPSFKGYVQAKYTKVDGFDGSNKMTFNTNSIAIQERDYASDKEKTRILFGEKVFEYDIPYKIFRYAMTEAETYPALIVNVERCKPPKRINYEI